MIEEDYERLSETDILYLQERENEIWEEYQYWLEEQEKQAAIINVIMPEENDERSIPYKRSSLYRE